MNTSDILWFLLLGALVIFMMRKGGGCCGGGHDDKTKPSTSGGHACGGSGMDAEPPQETAAGRKDPVCGMEVGQDAQGGTSIVDGVTYHFCSEHCKKKFDLEPEKFIQSTS